MAAPCVRVCARWFLLWTLANIPRKVVADDPKCVRWLPKNKKIQSDLGLRRVELDRPCLQLDFRDRRPWNHEWASKRKAPYHAGRNRRSQLLNDKPAEVAGYCCGKHNWHSYRVPRVSRQIRWPYTPGTQGRTEECRDSYHKASRDRAQTHPGVWPAPQRVRRCGFNHQTDKAFNPLMPEHREITSDSGISLYASGKRRRVNCENANA